MTVTHQLLKWVLTLMMKILNKNEDKLKRKTKQQNEKIKKREEKKRKTQQ